MFEHNMEHPERILKKMREHNPKEYDKRTGEMRKSYYSSKSRALKNSKHKGEKFFTNLHKVDFNRDLKELQ